MLSRTRQLACWEAQIEHEGVAGYVLISEYHTFIYFINPLAQSGAGGVIFQRRWNWLTGFLSSSNDACIFSVHRKKVGPQGHASTVPARSVRPNHDRFHQA